MVTVFWTLPAFLGYIILILLLRAGNSLFIQ